VDIPKSRFANYYEGYANRVLWFLHHGLEEEPYIEEAAEAWADFVAANEAFADRIAEIADRGARILVQDYHLSLLPRMLRDRRADLLVSLFWHIPFCEPGDLASLARGQRNALMQGMLGADVVGFHSPRWTTAFAGGARLLKLGDVSMTAGVGTVSTPTNTCRIEVNPVGVDPEFLHRAAKEPAVAEASAWIERLSRNRRLILRVDRTDLSKNIVRGFAAFEELLIRRPDLHGNVVHLALLTPSRAAIPEYRGYADACRMRANDINRQFGTDDWTPVTIDEDDDLSRALAAYLLYDVLLVNPIADGMNLVAREGPVLNERDGVLVLSRTAGAADELAPASLVVDPFDTHGTSLALERALGFDAEERAERAALLRTLAPGRSPAEWLTAQLDGLRD
jgi:trehalose 6-phosphate synthase